MAFSFLPKEGEYFAFFTQMSAKIQDAAQLLVQMVSDDHDEFDIYYQKIKDVEHDCDDLCHKVTTKLNRSFVTPFDREDIYTLTVALDDVCDYIDAAARRMMIFDIQDFNDHSKNLTEVIYRLSAQIHGAVSMLNRPNGMNHYIVEIHRLENEADDIYFRAMTELFREVKDPIVLIKWKELYEILEYATDRCESVANIIESIVLKHN